MCPCCNRRKFSSVSVRSGKRYSRVAGSRVTRICPRRIRWYTQCALTPTAMASWETVNHADTGNRTALVTTRPCRAPHQTISAVGLIGGGQVPMPGEVSLAHHGVLFLDDRPESRRHGLEVLCQPLEEGITQIQ